MLRQHELCIITSCPFALDVVVVVVSLLHLVERSVSLLTFVVAVCSNESRSVRDLFFRSSVPLMDDPFSLVKEEVR